MASAIESGMGVSVAVPCGSPPAKGLSGDGRERSWAAAGTAEISRQSAGMDNRRQSGKDDRAFI
jgi:hypothetical protein